MRKYLISNFLNELHRREVGKTINKVTEFLKVQCLKNM